MMGALPPEVVLVVFLPAALHTPQERSALQQRLLREIGHGIPATDTLPLRNVSLDFFEAIMSIPTSTPMTSYYHLQRQQENQYYHYYSAIQPFVPFRALVSKLHVVNVEITGAVIIERQFDSICKYSAAQQITNPLNSALVLRTTAQAKLPSPQNNPHLAPFLCATNSRPAAWYAQGLPFMNKTSWARLYATSQLKTSKSP
jgi:hypothetical protein